MKLIREALFFYRLSRFFSKQAETESLVKFKPYDSILAFFMGQDYIFFHRVKFFQNSLMKDSY